MTRIQAEVLGDFLSGTSHGAGLCGHGDGSSPAFLSALLLIDCYIDQAGGKSVTII